VLEKGKEALNMLNIPMMNPEIVQLIGKFFFRYSYGQNLRHHSIEVAKIAE
jgi:ribonuclease Y